jgi:hypothetical protein
LTRARWLIPSIVEPLGVAVRDARRKRRC